MATLVQSFDATGLAAKRPATGNSRNRIIAAAANVLQHEPDNFSVQRVARQAGISARAVYGYFESGAELARTARLSTLDAIISRLPSDISGVTQPAEALQHLAHEIAKALRPHGSAWLLASRQDDVFRTQYRHAVRWPLISLVEAYILARRGGATSGFGHSKLAEILVTAIESIVVNYDPQLALGDDCADVLDEIVRAICEAHDI